MNRSRELLFLTAAATVLLLRCGKSEARVRPPQPPVVLVFADVTDSLQPGGAEAVDKAIFDIFDRAPDEATIRVYPIVAVMDVVPASETTFPFETNTGFQAVKNAHDTRSKAARKVVGELSAIRRKLDPKVPSSCLSGALRRAASDMTSYPGRPVDVVIISDMVEDCAQSVRGRIALTHRGIAKEIALAGTLTPDFANLRKANVYFVYPASVAAGLNADAKSAAQHELRTFWSTVARRCNAGDIRFIAGPELYRHDEWKSARRALEQLQNGR